MMRLAASHLAGEVNSLTTCWKIRRRDGVTLGYTSHDRDIWMAGTCYRANPGVTPSAVTIDDSFEPSSMEVEGLLDSDQISAEDLEAGRWNGAEMELLVCDWVEPEAGTLRLARGSIGDVVRQSAGGKGGFRAEVVSDMLKLRAAGAPVCSPTCRAQLGDDRCGVDMAGRQLERTVSNSDALWIECTEAISAPEALAFGRVRVLTGRWAGLDRRILATDGTRLFLDEPLPEALPVAVTIMLEEGCDKRFATCCDRFGNAVRFDGEPHVPGTDVLLRYAEP